MDGLRPAFGHADSNDTDRSGTAGAVLGLLVVVGLVAGVVWSAVAGPTPTASRPGIFSGSLVLEDQRPLTVVDVATGQVTVRLPGVYAQVGATGYGEVQAVPARGGTFLVDRTTGAFNLLGADDYVLDSTGAGIGLGQLTGSTGARGFADGADLYVLRVAPHSTVSLVDAATVAAGAAHTVAARASQGLQAGSSPAIAEPAKAAAVTALGFASLDGSARPGSTVVAGDDLWTVVSTREGICRLEQLAPAAGATLSVTPRARLADGCGPVAVDAVDGGPGGPVAAMATPGAVVLLGQGRTQSRRIAVPRTSAATALVPVTGPSVGTAAVGRTAWWLVGDATGWSVVGVGTDGTVTGPSRLAGVPAGAEPAPPVGDAGALWTLDRAGVAQPALWRIDPASGAVTTVGGQARYPRRSPLEQASFAGAEVTADGPRVVYNNPASLLAVDVFTDGTHAPVTLDKSTALDVSASGPGVPDLGGRPPGAASISPTAPPGGASGGPVRPHPAPAPIQAVVIDPQVGCASRTLKPYAPTISTVQPSTQSALVTWTYQLLDQQDCEPSTWSVTITALGGAPQPARPTQEVDGQQQLQVTGLRPATTYQAVVDAHLDAQSTPSQPVTFTTAEQGPDAPAGVTTTADGQGDWIVSWTPCSASACFVPAAQWDVSATACGGSFVPRPPTAEVPAGTTSVIVAAASTGLLGDSVSFSVQGATSSGLLGPPAADGACTQAWQPPQASDIALSGAATPSGPTLTATLTVTETGAPALAWGDSDPSFTYSVGGHTVGPTGATTVTVAGLQPGVRYTPTVVVGNGHPGDEVTVSGSSFTQDIPWPAIVLSATVVPNANPDTGTLAVTAQGLPRGTYSAGGRLTCGSTTHDLGGPLTNGTLTDDSIDLDHLGAPCQVSLTLDDGDHPNPYGVPSPPATTTVTSFGTPPDYAFSAAYPSLCDPALGCGLIDVSFDGPGQPAKGGIDWSVKAVGTHGGDSCTETTPQTEQPSFPVVVLQPICAADARHVTVAVSYLYLGQIQTVETSPLSGDPPTPPTTTTTTSTTTTTVPHATSTTRPQTTTTTKAAGPGANVTGPPSWVSSQPASAGSRWPCPRRPAPTGPLPAPPAPRWWSSRSPLWAPLWRLPACAVPGGDDDRC